MTPRVVIVGPPGSGKSTVGKALAAQLGLAFRDTDADVEEREARTIADIFVDQGEAAFRVMERDAVRVALEQHDGVLALGGGAVMDERTRERLGGHAVAFLDVTPGEAAARVGLNRDRPLLLGAPRATLARLMRERRPLYEEVATIVVSTDGRTPDEVAAQIAEALT